MMTSEVVRTLEEKGLVTRAVHPRDPRARVVSLTAEGQYVVQRAVTLVEVVDEQFFKELGGQAPSIVESMQQLIRANAQGPTSSDKR